MDVTSTGGVVVVVAAATVVDKMVVVVGEVREEVVGTFVEAGTAEESPGVDDAPGPFA